MEDYTMCPNCKNELNKIAIEIINATVDNYYRIDHKNKTCEITGDEIVEEEDHIIYCLHCGHKIEGEQCNYILKIIEGWDYNC